MSEIPLRKWVWLHHGCSIGVLYGDDGEMQCSNGHLLDFKRMPIDEVLYWLAFGGEAQAHVRNHHIESCVSCAATESERDALQAELAEAIDQNASIIALVACANCTHQPDGSAACSLCIADAVRTRQPLACI